VLTTTLPQVGEAIKEKDQALFKQRIEGLRAACTSCHAAEKHAFIKIGLPTVRRNPVEKP
jgi:cytochrome c551/c552